MDSYQHRRHSNSIAPGNSDQEDIAQHQMNEASEATSVTVEEFCERLVRRPNVEARR